MGKRKSSKPPPKKKADKLDVTFSCPFCNSAKSVSAVLDHEKELGTVICALCQSKYACRITSLTEPIDIYHGEACELVVRWRPCAVLGSPAPLG